MSRPRTTAGKRNVQQQKQEKARAKSERRAARRTADDPADFVAVDLSEAELIGALADLHRAAEAGQVSHQQFEERREDIRRQLEQVQRHGR